MVLENPRSRVDISTRLVQLPTRGGNLLPSLWLLFQWSYWQVHAMITGPQYPPVKTLKDRLIWQRGFPGGSVEKNLPARRCRFHHWVGKIPLDGNENSVQYSCLGNPMDRGAWRAAVHVVTKSQITQLSINNNKPDKAISSVQLLSHVWLFVTSWTATCQACLSITNFWCLLKLMSIELVMPSNHLILCHPLLLLPSIFPSIRVFSNDRLFLSGALSIGASASALVLPMNIQDWFPSQWTGWISLQSKGLSRIFSNTIVQKHQFFSAQLSLWFNSHIHI